MNVTCPSCATIYRVDPEKVPERGVRARCRVCAAVFAVDRTGREAPAGAPAAMAAGPAPAQVATPFDSWKDPVSTRYAPPAAVEPAREEPVAPPAPPAAPREEHPEPARATRTAVPPPAPQARPGAMIGMPPVVPPGASRPGGPAPAAAPSRPAGRRVNPFMTQDPDQKARRLARALISDLVVYYPERREEGLRNNNLKSLFDEEIRKSWEEYTDQVGEEMAESTSHFTDALNEILAGGRQVF